MARTLRQGPSGLSELSRKVAEALEALAGSE